nr:diaminopimelate epimerase [Kofleriaceae bacterium]
MKFAKLQGAGNDFLVVDLRVAAAADAVAAQDPQNVIAACDRQFGVGGDGVLAILPPTTPGAVARMRVLNADGSEAEMCGNGIRCVAKELYERGGVREPRMVIDTGAGPLTCELDLDARDEVRGVTVAMGAPRLRRADIPMRGPADERCIDAPLDGTSLAVTAVSMGNPHAIAFVDSRDDAYRLATTLGPTVERHAAFPNRTNSEFAFVRTRREIDLVVWERGCGITLACGTGACATAVAAITTGRCDDAELAVHLPGGTLAIRVTADNVYMRGPAARAFDGELDFARLARRPS